MRRTTNGFTLIELLIVIAIIGILAAVLIPQLLNARIQAQERAAQAYSQNVYTAFNAALASDTTATVASLVTADGGVGACEAAGTAGPASIGQYGWNTPPASVLTCDVTDGGTDFLVTATTEYNQYVNGEQQALPAP